MKAVSADYWLNAGSASSRGEIAAIDERLSQLECFKTGNIFNNNKRTGKEGGNDYWEGGCPESSHNPEGYCFNSAPRASLKGMN